jgi:hypothetical protein
MEAVMAYFKVLFQYFSGEPEETHKKPHLEQLLSNQYLNLDPPTYEASVHL